MSEGAHSSPDGEAGPIWRHEARAVIAIAAPAAATQLGLMSMGAVDAMMLGRYSAEAMAAGALGHNVSMAVIIMAQGLLMAIDPLVAQSWGSSDRSRVRFHFQQGLMLAVTLSIPIALALFRVEPLLEAFRQQASIVAPTAAYVRTVTAGVPAFLMFVALRRGLQAMDIVRPALGAIVLANGINVIANWVLIFGHFGMPRLGVVGSAWATTISRWSMFLLLLWLARRHLAPLGLSRRWPKPQLNEFRLFLRIGVPISVHTGVEFWMITGVALMMGTLGAVELAGHQVALILAALAYMTSLGISGAAAARVGQAIGGGDMRRARVACQVALLLSAVTMSISAALFLSVPSLLSRLFTDDPGVIAIASMLLPIAALFQIFDGLQVVATGALRGAADTRAPATIAVLGYWVVCLPLGYALTYYWDLGAVGPWWGLAVGLGVSSVLLLWRTYHRLSRPVASVFAAP